MEEINHHDRPAFQSDLIYFSLIPSPWSDLGFGQLCVSVCACVCVYETGGERRARAQKIYEDNTR